MGDPIRIQVPSLPMDAGLEHGRSFWPCAGGWRCGGNCCGLYALGIYGNRSDSGFLVGWWEVLLSGTLPEHSRLCAA